MSTNINTKTAQAEAEARAKGYRTNGHGKVTGFDVTCVVGSVSFDDAGDEHPFLAACRVIHESGGAGVFSFPHGVGGNVIIEIPRYT